MKLTLTNFAKSLLLVLGLLSFNLKAQCPVAASNTLIAEDTNTVFNGAGQGTTNTINSPYTCNSMAFLIWPTSTNTTSIGIMQPCIRTRYNLYYTSLRNNVTESFYENGGFIYSLAPANTAANRIGGATPPGSGTALWDFSLYQLDPTLTHSVSIVKTGAGAITSDSISIKDCWRNTPSASMVYTANPTFTTGTGLTWNDAANSGHLGTTAWSISPAATWPAVGAYNVGILYVDPRYLAPNTYTVTYTFTPPVNGTVNCPAVSLTYTFTVAPPSGNNPAWTNLPAQCSAGSCVSLNSQITGTTGGGWSGTGVSGTQFCPATAGAGSFPVTYTVGTSSTCYNSLTQTVTVNATPTLTVGSASYSVCPGGSVSISASGSTSYTWTPAGSLSSPNSGTTTATPGGTQVYTVTGTTSGCVSSPKTTTVTVATPPTISVGAANYTVCPGGTVSISASGASTYTWSPAGSLGSPNSGTTTATPGGTQVYTVTGSSAAGCVASSAATTTVSIASTPTISLGAANYTVCPGGTVGMSVSGATSYTWTPGGTLDNPNSSTPNSTPGGTTVYTVTGTGANGCVSSAGGTTTVTVNTPPTINLGSSTYTVCPGGSVGMSVSGASTYTWTPASTLNNANSATPTSTPTASTVYTVSGTDASGCVSTTAGTTTVTINTPPTISVGAATYTVCPGGTVGISASGASTYTWSPATGLDNPNSATPNATPTVATVYTVTGTDASGCTATSSATTAVNISTPPTITVGSSNYTVCPGGTVGMSVSGASTFTWSPASSLDNANSATPNSTPTTTTVYTVTGTDASGCTASTSANATVTINTPITPTITANPASLCTGGTTTLTASGASTYTWSANLGSVSTNPVSVTPAGTDTYSVNGIDAAGCATNTGTVVVAIGAALTPTITASSASMCSGQTTTLTASGATNYTWLPGNSNATSITVSPTSNQTYTLTGDNGGCSGSTTLIVTVTATPTLTTSSSSPGGICSGATATLTAGSATNYTWMPGSITTNTASVSPTTTTDYTVTGSDASGVCTSTAVVTVSVTTTPTVSAIATAGSATVCAGQTYTLTGSGASSYTWAPGPLIGSPQTVTPAAGVTTYTVVGSNGSCISALATVTVNVTALPTMTVSGNSAAICSGDPAVIMTASGATNYTWMPGSVNTNTISVNPGTTTDYTITGEAGGCTSTTVATLTVTPSPTLAITSSSGAAICSGSSTTLSGASASNYTWLPGGSNASSITVSPTSAQTYTLIGANGTCSTSVTQAIAVNSTPTITAVPSSDSAICGGANGGIHPVNVTGGTGPFTYAWSNGTTSGVDSLTGVPAGTYSVLITDANGCQTSASAISVPGSPLVIASISPSSTQGQAPVSVNFGNGTTGAVAYNWNFGNGTGSVFQSPTVTYNTPGTYTVVMTASNGPMCFDSDTAIVIVDAATSIVIPNIFSPNGDGINDNFGIITTGIKTLNCDIFNRWGTKITSLTAPSQLWDGKTSNGSDATEGTYYYMLTAKGYDGKDYTYQGPLTLVK